jgi:hypothetical protein
LGERFRLGRVVARSFAIWGREMPLLLAIAFVVHAPRVVCVELVDLAVPEFPGVEDGGDLDADSFIDRVDRWLWRAVPVQLASFLLGTLFADLSLALVVFAVYARLRGQKATFGESVRGGVRRILPVLRVSLCLFVLAAGLGFGAWLLAWKLIRLGHLVAAALLAGLPMLALIKLLLSPFWVAVPAAVVEEPRKLLRRSVRLARGHRLAVCAVVLLLYAVDWGSGRLLWLGLGSADLPGLAWKGIGWAQDLLMVSLKAVFAAVGYHALRLEKEGVDVSDLERVFA